MQIADIRYTSEAAFAGSALHILHRGSNYIVYIATAQETGLKLLLKAYDISEHPVHKHFYLFLPVLNIFICLALQQCLRSWQGNASTLQL